MSGSKRVRGVCSIATGTPKTISMWGLSTPQGTSILGKLDRNWEGPLRVEAVVKPGTTKLAQLDGTEVP